MAAIISSFSGGAVRTCRSVSGSCPSGTIKAGGLVRTSLKCSAHPVSCSASVVNGLSSLSTISESVPQRYMLLTRLVILHTCPCSALLAASSALLCQVFHVGLLVCPCHPLHCLVCLSVTLPASLSLSDVVPMTLFFRALLLLMSHQVSVVIHSFLFFLCLRPRLASLVCE